MQEPAPQPLPTTPQYSTIEARLALETRLRNGVNWFFWTAGLSILNSIIYILGGTFTFIFGLGATQVVDGLVTAIAELGEESLLLQVIGFGINLLLAGIFVAIGILGNKRKRWAVIFGMALYGLDGLIFLLVGGWLAIAFHAWALWGLGSGLRAMTQLANLENGLPVSISTTPIFYQTERREKPPKVIYIILAVLAVLAAFTVGAVFLTIVLGKV